MDKALNYMALARKAGRIELGEEPVGGAARAGKACLVAVAADAGDHTWRRAKSFVAGTDQVAVKIPFTKDDIGQAIGRTSLAIAAFTDPAMALAFLKALPQQENYSEALQALEGRTQRVRQRQQEAKAHEKNKRMGKSPAGMKKR
jgi:ribosomal protein L7Ae-like RNA K-turn-binding protein